MRALCLDIATRTGFCVLLDEWRDSGVVDLSLNCPKKGGEFVRHPFILAALATLLRELIEQHRPDFLIIEEGFSRGPGSQLLHRLIGVAMSEAELAGIGVLAVPGSTWKKAILGKGNLSSEAAKAASVEVASGIIPSVTDDNEADAVCISIYAERFLETAKAA